MQFRRKTSSRFSNGLPKFIIKSIIVLIFISIVVIILDRVKLPAPNKNIQKKIPNEQFKVVK